MMLSMGINKRKSPVTRDRFLSSKATANTELSPSVASLPPPPTLFTNRNPSSLAAGETLFLERTKHTRSEKSEKVTGNDTTRYFIRWIAGSMVFVALVLSMVSNSLIRTRHYNIKDSVHIIERSTNATVHPRTCQFLGHGNEFPSLLAAWFTSAVSDIHRPSKASVEPLVSDERLEQIKDSDEYYERQTDSFETEQCKAMFPWQRQSFPTCNSLHELDMLGASTSSAFPRNPPLFLTSGFWRDVWLVPNATWHDGNVILKTIRFTHNVTERNFDRNRRDALVMERLTKSPWILDIYAFCGNSGFYEYADGQDISSALWPKDPRAKKYNIRRANRRMTRQQKLEIAVQAAIALAELHNFDKEEQASVAHTDISPAQFVNVRGRYKLQDFNRARFIRWNNNTQQPCPFNVSNNPGKNRSPEEYAYKPQTEKVDVYSLGNLFYMLLQMEWPFKDETTKETKELVKDGYRPSFYEDVWNSKDPYDVALKEAMLMCHKHEAENRSSAREVANFLKTQLERLNPGILKQWGEQVH